MSGRARRRTTRRRSESPRGSGSRSSSRVERRRFSTWARCATRTRCSVRPRPRACASRAETRPWTTWPRIRRSFGRTRTRPSRKRSASRRHGTARPAEGCAWRTARASPFRARTACFGASRRARSNGFLVHTHAAENMDEVALVVQRTGKRNVAYLDDVGISGSHVVLAHVIHTDEAERALLAARGTVVAHCPSSNLKLGSGICPVPEYRARGIRVTLGADGAPCNDRLDAFAEMRLAALLPKIRLGPGALSAWEVVRMATADGAAALGLPTGTLEPGRGADFVLLDPGAGFADPMSWRDDPYGPIVYCMDRSHVVATFVEGVPRYRRAEPFPLKPTAVEIESAVAALKRRRSQHKR